MLSELCILYFWQHSLTAVNTSNAAAATETADDDILIIVRSNKYMDVEHNSSRAPRGRILSFPLMYSSCRITEEHNANC